MKYTKEQVYQALSKLDESLTPKTTEKLDEYAAQFAQWMKELVGESDIFEKDADAFDEIKKTLKAASKEGNVFRAVVLKTVFKDDVKTLGAILETPEQIKYFAGKVFQIWREDETMKAWLKKHEPAGAAKYDTFEEYIAKLRGGITEDDDEAAKAEAAKKALQEVEPETETPVQPSVEKTVDEADLVSNISRSGYEPNTVGALIYVLKRDCKPEDKLMFLVEHQEHFVFDIASKNGYCSFDLKKGRID